MRMARAVAPFTLDAFDQAAPYAEDGDVAYAKASIVKTFAGDLAATSTVEMLSVRAGEEGAGYVALERIVGTLDGLAGTFALLHMGTMSGGDHWAKWPVVPGSGTGQLRGISGEAVIDIAPDGSHTLVLDYVLA